MIIEMRTYSIKPGELHNFINIYDKEIRQIHKKILGNQIGFFYTEIGNVNEVVHLYGYDSYEDRQSRRNWYVVGSTIASASDFVYIWNDRIIW